jgi:hypothetical protein
MENKFKFFEIFITYLSFLKKFDLILKLDFNKYPNIGLNFKVFQ